MRSRLAPLKQLRNHLAGVGRTNHPRKADRRTRTGIRTRQNRMRIGKRATSSKRPEADGRNRGFHGARIGHNGRGNVETVRPIGGSGLSLERPAGKEDEPRTAARPEQTDGQAGKTGSAGEETGPSLGPFLPCRGPERRVPGLLERMARHVSFLRPRRRAWSRSRFSPFRPRASLGIGFWSTRPWRPAAGPVRQYQSGLAISGRRTCESGSGGRPLCERPAAWRR